MRQYRGPLDWLRKDHMHMPAFPYHAISQNVSQVKTPEPVAAIMVELEIRTLPDVTGSVLAIPEATAVTLPVTENTETKVKLPPKRKTASPKAAVAKTKKKAKG
jgi:hypothetical protein